MNLNLEETFGCNQCQDTGLITRELEGAPCRVTVTERCPLCEARERAAFHLRICKLLERR